MRAAVIIHYAFYFALAFLPSLLSADAAPATGWSWFKWIGTASYQGLLALKALQSKPPGSVPENLTGGKA